MNDIITIDNRSIHQDRQGRYSLNDLHAASGGKRRHEPNRFMRLDSTQELIQSLIAENKGNYPDLGNLNIEVLKSRNHGI